MKTSEFMFKSEEDEGRKWVDNVELCYSEFSDQHGFLFHLTIPKLKEEGQEQN